MLKPDTGLTVALAQRGISRRPFIHSFDPCIACAVHVMDVKGREYSTVKVD